MLLSRSMRRSRRRSRLPRSPAAGALLLGPVLDRREQAPHRDEVTACADDQEAVDAAGYTGKLGPRLCAQPRFVRANAVETEDQGIGREPVSPLGHQFRSWHRRGDVKARCRRTVGKWTGAG